MNEKGRFTQNLWDTLGKMGTKPIFQNGITRCVTNWLNGHGMILFGQQKQMGIYIYGLMRGYIEKNGYRNNKVICTLRTKTGIIRATTAA
jgi:hypothetical protein